MASILKVDTIQDQAGNNIISESANVITIGASGDTITVPAGATVSGFTSAGIDDNATSTAITIDSSQNVGIGTSNPDADLHISGSGSTIRFTDEANSQSWQWQAANDRFEIRDVTQAVERFTVLPSGNIGLGTTTPGRKVSIYDSSSPYLALQNSTSGTTNTDGLLIGIGGSNAFIINYENQPLTFSTNNFERVRIDNSGKVLVGTSSESQGTLTVHSDVDYTTTEFEDNNALTLKNNDFTNPACMVFRSSNSGGSTYRSGITGGWDNSLGQGIAFYGDIINKDRNDNPDVFIRSDGRVGIGETSLDALLVIKGDTDYSTIPSIRMKDGSDSREAWISNQSGDLFIANGGDDNTPHCFAELKDGNTFRFGTANTERMRINSDGAVSIASTNVTQNSHFNVRQDNNSHATRTYLNANVASGAFYSIKYLGTIPVVSSGTQLLIPFISQSNINSKTYVHIRGMSCESNTSDPKAFDVKFSIGHISTLGTLTVLQNLGTCTGVSKSGMNVVLSFNTNYQHSGDNGMFIEIDYIAHHQDASINLGGIVMN